jgi:hypothetical protein
LPRSAFREVAILGPPLPPTTLRLRRSAVAFSAFAALALLFGLHVYRWHVPYRLGGIWGELLLLGSAVALGVAASIVLARIRPRLARARIASTAVAALTAFVALLAADPFVTRRDWRYAPAGCGFAVYFPRPPEIVAGEARLGEGQSRSVLRALLTNVGEASSLSAECLAFERPLAERERDAVLAAAEAQLKASAARLKLEVEHVARENRDAVVLSGSSDEGRTATNETLLRRARAEVRLGPASLLIVWGWRIEREGDPRRVSPLDGLRIEAAPSSRR